jgi:hypothetical protein
MKLPQLSLRELFLLVLIAAMACGWWVDHQSHVGLRGDMQAIQEVNELVCAELQEASTKIYDLSERLKAEMSKQK